jgi:hypothetical protein
MLRRILLAGLTICVALVVFTSVPDLQRYLKMRSM